jgi:hypothetical protein
MHGSETAHLLGLRVRIPQGSWMSLMGVLYLSGRALCPADHSSRVVIWSAVCITEYNHEASIMRGPWPTTGLCAMGKKNPVSNNKIFSQNQGLMLLLLFWEYPIFLSARTLKYATVLQGNTGIAGLFALYHIMAVSLPVHCSLLSNNFLLYAFWLLTTPLSKQQKRKKKSPKPVDQSFLRPTVPNTAVPWATMMCFVTESSNAWLLANSQKKWTESGCNLSILHYSFNMLLKNPSLKRDFSCLCLWRQ